MQVNGELCPWHKIKLDFEGPPVGETASSFRGYRLGAFDVSKLAQREIVFEHMQKRGINLHLILQETENDQLLNGGDLGAERMLCMHARTGGPTRPARRVRRSAPAS